MAEYNMHGPGMVLNRHAKRGKIEIAFDPSECAFVSKCGAATERLRILIVPGEGGMEPIEISASPKAWVFKCESAAVPPDRLADLEALITEEASVHVVVEYSPSQDELPFERNTGHEPRHTDSEATEATEATEVTEDTEADELPSGRTWSDTVRTEAAPGTLERRGRETIVVKFKGLKKVSATISVGQEPGGWSIGFDLQFGNWLGHVPIGGPGPFRSRAEALAAAQQKIARMLTDDVPITGTADQKRAMTRRRDMMIEQVAAWLRKLAGEEE